MWLLKTEETKLSQNPLWLVCHLHKLQKSFKFTNFGCSSLKVVALVNAKEHFFQNVTDLIWFSERKNTSHGLVVTIKPWVPQSLFALQTLKRCNMLHFIIKVVFDGKKLVFFPSLDRLMDFKLPLSLQLLNFFKYIFISCLFC